MRWWRGCTLASLSPGVASRRRRRCSSRPSSASTSAFTARLRRFCMDTDTAEPAMRSPAIWRCRMSATRVRWDASTAWPCGCLRGVTRRCAGRPEMRCVPYRGSPAPSSMWQLPLAMISGVPWPPIQAVGCGPPALGQRRFRRSTSGGVHSTYRKSQDGASTQACPLLSPSDRPACRWFPAHSTSRLRK